MLLRRIRALVTFAPKVTKEEGVIDWNAHATTIHDMVRGLQPWPLASAVLGGRRYVIRRTVVDPDRVDALPGTIVRAHGDVLTAAAGGGSIVRLLECSPRDDGRLRRESFWPAIVSRLATGSSR